MYTQREEKLTQEDRKKVTKETFTFRNTPDRETLSGNTRDRKTVNKNLHGKTYRMF